MAPVFRTKIICAAIVLVCTPVLAIWLAVNPAVLLSGSAGRAVFIGLALVSLAAAGTAGFMGGKLVFPNRDN